MHFPTWTCPARRVGATGLALLLAAACGELPRDNPADPGFVLRPVIEGPDTVHALWPVVVYTVSGIDAWKGHPPTWTSSNPRILASYGDGRFRMFTEGTVDVIIKVGDNRASKTVVIRQVPANFFISDPIQVQALGERRVIRPVLTDSAGSVIATTFAISVSDTSVISFSGDVLTAVGPGNAWLYAESVERGVRDSVAVNVTQVARSIRLRVNGFAVDSVVVAVPSASVLSAQVTDANGNPMPDAVTLSLSDTRYQRLAGDTLRSIAYGWSTLYADGGGLERLVSVNSTGGTPPTVSLSGVLLTSDQGNAAFVHWSASDIDGDLRRESLIPGVFRSESFPAASANGYVLYSTQNVAKPTLAALDASYNSAVITETLRLKDVLPTTPVIDSVNVVSNTSDSVEVRVGITDSGLDVRAVWLMRRVPFTINTVVAQRIPVRQATASDVADVRAGLLGGDPGVLYLVLEDAAGRWSRLIIRSIP